MDKQTHNISFLAPCGLYCAICPQFNTRCKGCNSNQGVAKTVRRLCGITKCCKIQDIQRCNQCEIFPNCDALINFSKWDSFISHAPVIENLKSLNEMGEDLFIESMQEKVLNKEYPPVVREGTMSFRNFIQWMKVPIKRKKV